MSNHLEKTKERILVKSWEVVYLPSAETMRVTPDQGPSRA